MFLVCTVPRFRFFRTLLTTIRRIRAKAAVSQAIFAAHLNVTTGVVSKWERGEKQPRGPAAKLLTLAAKNGIAAIA